MRSRIGWAWEAERERRGRDGRGVRRERGEKIDIFCDTCLYKEGVYVMYW